MKRVLRRLLEARLAHHAAASFAGFDPHARFRDVIGEVTAHGDTANGTIRGTAP